MNRLLSISLLFVMLLQVLSRPVIVANYELNKERITALFCENKDLPELHCNGKCHLSKQLEKQKETSQSQERNAEVSVHFLQPALMVLTTVPAFVEATINTDSYLLATYHSPSQKLLQPPKV